MNGVFGRMRLVGFGLLAITFVAGALSGAAIDRVLSADEPERVERDRDRRDRGRSYIIDRVEMTDEQRAAIDEILEQRAERMRAVWREAEPRLDAITDSARAEIMEVLTPEQRAEYERRLNERRRDHRRDGGARQEEAADGERNGRR